jgi:hypothetical protein
MIFCAQMIYSFKDLESQMIYSFKDLESQMIYSFKDLESLRKRVSACSAEEGFKVNPEQANNSRVG